MMYQAPSARSGNSGAFMQLFNYLGNSRGGAGTGTAANPAPTGFDALAAPEQPGTGTGEGWAQPGAAPEPGRSAFGGGSTANVIGQGAAAPKDNSGKAVGIAGLFKNL